MVESAARLADVVSLTLPAEARQVSTARVVVASLAAGAGFDVDAIDDLRLAVAEAAGLLLDDAPDSLAGSLVVEYQVEPGQIRVSMRRTGSPLPSQLDDLAVRILDAVVDHFEVVDGAIVLSAAARPSE